MLVLKLKKHLFIMGLLLLSLQLNAVELSSRIIGGQDTSIEKWKSMAALVDSPDISNASLYNRQFCGGNLIADNWVVSAAHCLFRSDNSTGSLTQVSADTIRVILGIDNLNDSPVEELVVTNIIIHEDYDPSSQSSPNDIVLLELAHTTDTQKMDLFLQNTSEGMNSVVTGWGATSFDPLTENAGGFPEQLMEVTVPIVSNDTCASVYSALGGIIESSQLCAGLQEGGKDSCSGDSGGPLMVEENGIFKQAGIVSFGAGCALADAYGVYTRVSSFASWIENYIPNEPSKDVSGSSDTKDSGLGAGLLLFVILTCINAAVMLSGSRREKNHA